MPSSEGGSTDASGSRRPGNRSHRDAGTARLQSEVSVGASRPRAAAHERIFPSL